MQKILLELLHGLKDKKYVDQKIYQKFLNRLNSSQLLLRGDNAQDHFATFFLPVDRKTKSIFLVHHKKANDWIPPGGHIDKGELPSDTVIREMKEELDCIITKEQVCFYDITITEIRNKRSFPCRRHWDLWYLVWVSKSDFRIEKKEFYTAGWFGVKEAATKTKKQSQRKEIQKILKLFDFNPEG